MALSRRPYLHADHVRQLELDRLNWLHVGAALRGGYVSIEDEDRATELREAEEKARMEEWKKVCAIFFKLFSLICTLHTFVAPFVDGNYHLPSRVHLSNGCGYRTNSVRASA